jgi:hypothetical protein
MFPTSLRDYTKDVSLNAGDMIIDSVSGQIGLLLEYNRRISITSDDVYFWNVKWSNNDHTQKPEEVINPIWIEEEGLKLSILVGFYNLHTC